MGQPRCITIMRQALKAGMTAQELALMACLCDRMDLLRYREAPRFSDRELAKTLRMDRKTIHRLRRKLYEIKWLTFARGTKGTRAVYWPSIPGEGAFEGLSNEGQKEAMKVAIELASKRDSGVNGHQSKRPVVATDTTSGGE